MKNEVEVTEIIARHTILPFSMTHNPASKEWKFVLHTPFGNKIFEFSIVDSYLQQESYVVSHPTTTSTEYGVFGGVKSETKSGGGGYIVPELRQHIKRDTTLEELIAWIKKQEREIWFKYIGFFKEENGLLDPSTLSN